MWRLGVIQIDVQDNPEVYLTTLVDTHGTFDRYRKKIPGTRRLTYLGAEQVPSSRCTPPEKHLKAPSRLPKVAVTIHRQRLKIRGNASEG